MKTDWNLVINNPNMLWVDGLGFVKEHDKRQISYVNDESEIVTVGKDNPLRKWDYIKNDKIYIGSGERPYEEDDEIDINVITDMTNTVYKLAEPKVYDLLQPINLPSYEDETTVSCASGVILPTMKFKMTSYITELIKSNRDRIDQLEDLALAQLMISLNLESRLIILEEGFNQ